MEPEAQGCLRRCCQNTNWGNYNNRHLSWLAAAAADTSTDTFRLHPPFARLRHGAAQRAARNRVSGSGQVLPEDVEY